MRHRVASFSKVVTNALDGLNFTDRQKLLRLVIDEVTVTSWDVQIRLRVPLDDPPETSAGGTGQLPKAGAPPGMSSSDRLRSLGGHRRGVVPHARGPPEGWAQAEDHLKHLRGGDFYLAKSGDRNSAIDTGALRLRAGSQTR